MKRLLCSSLCLLPVVACDAAPGAAIDPDDPTTLPDGPVATAPIEVEAADDDPVDVPVHAGGELIVSRFGPTLGLAGTRVTVLVGFDPRGCDAAGACRVTLGGFVAPVAGDEGTLDVLVPDGAQTGPLCVTWRGREQCAGDFTVLPAPLIYAVDVGARGPDDADVHLSVTGAGFLPDAEVWLAWEPLPTTHEADWRLTARVPADRLDGDGERSVWVYSPSTGRCGARSEPFVLTLE